MFQAHCGVWPHHLRVSVSLPQGLPPRGPGGCGRGGGLPTQVHVGDIFMSQEF